MPDCPTIETDRLVLRPFRDSDLDDYTRVMTAPEVRHWLRKPDDFGRDEAWAEMALWSGQWALRGTGQWAVEEKATGRVVGRAGTHNPERVGWPGIELGWTLHPEVWGRGYATEAGRASGDWAFATFGVDELVSCILPDNVASQAVARRLGGRVRERIVLASLLNLPHDVWSYSRESWPAG